MKQQQVITECVIYTKTGKLKGFLHSSGHHCIVLEVFRVHTESMNIVKREHLLHKFDGEYCLVTIPVAGTKKEMPKYYTLVCHD